MLKQFSKLKICSKSAKKEPYNELLYYQKVSEYETGNATIIDNRGPKISGGKYKTLTAT